MTNSSSHTAEDIEILHQRLNPPPALKFHPLANLFPLMDGEEFAALQSDIAAHGVREPVVLFDGQILDGRNRYRASQLAGVD